MAKTPFKASNRHFNLKFLLAANSGAGKTDLCGSYTLGPTHFYMLDKGGEKTLEKNRIGRTDKNPMLSVDIMSKNSDTFSDFWHQIQQDDKDGFFDELAEQNGLLVIDSITSLNAKALKEICQKNRVYPESIGKALDMKKSIASPHWGQLLNWMTTLTSTLQELPCAVAATVHIHVLMNAKQEVVGRYPYVNGQFRQLIAVDFDEAYLLEVKGEKYSIHFKERNKFNAKSRVFSMKQAEGKTMNDIATAYMTEKTVI